jgi:hypothetical protein
MDKQARVGFFPIVSDYVKVQGSRWVWRVSGIWSRDGVPYRYILHFAGLPFIKKVVRQTEITGILDA